MDQQKKLILACFVACLITKIFIANSILALIITILLTCGIYITVKTVFDVSCMRNCTKDYEEFVERIKSYESYKNK